MKKPIHTAAIGLFVATAIVLAAAPGHAKDQQDQRRIEVAFVLDTTGSMSGLIDGAKRKIWAIANTIVDIHPNAEIRMALIGYRDRGDDYVLKTFDMSTDIQGLYGNLIAFQAQGGGDSPESVNEALDEAVRNLNWGNDKNAERIIFLVGDAPPHMDYDNAPKYPEVIVRAGKKDIIINAVQAGTDGETRQIWQQIARTGNGRYIQIPQDGGRVVVIKTPYDSDIIILQKRLDKTVIPYGTSFKQDEVRQKMSLKAAASEGVQVENSRFYSKRTDKREVITGGGDLVADIDNGVTTWEKMDPKDLPDNLKGLSQQEQKDYIKEQLATRAALEESMKKLMEKRDTFVSEETTTTEPMDSFDKAIQETLREQLS